MSKNKNSINIPLISTIIVAAAAAVLAVSAAIVILTQNPDEPSGSRVSSASTADTSYLTEEYREECEYAAHDLLNDSHEILRLFVTEGLFHDDEPYGNLPEDGYYTVNSTDYTTLEQIEELVRSVYTDSAAEKILTNVDGNGLVVYADREILEKVEKPVTTAEVTAEPETEETGNRYEKVYKLGISSDFLPDESKSWSSCAITIEYVENGKCNLIAYLDGADSTNGITDENRDSVMTLTMVKQEDGWRLDTPAIRGEQTE